MTYYYIPFEFLSMLCYWISSKRNSLRTWRSLIEQQSFINVKWSLKSIVFFKNLNLWDDWTNSEPFKNIGLLNTCAIFLAKNEIKSKTISCGEPEYVENSTWGRGHVKFIVECSTRCAHLWDIEIEHEKINLILCPSPHVLLLII